MIEIDWDALLPTAPPAARVPDAPRFEPAPTLPDAAADNLAARVREGDNRRRCTECRNLNERGLCLAAHRGEIVASRGYTPVRDLLRRCEGFKPLPSDPDRRTSLERWGTL